MSLEIFTNNARGVLRYAHGASANYLALEPGTGGKFAARRGDFGGGRIQRATLFSPDDPDVFEIVYIHSIYSDGVDAWRLGVFRGEEGTEPRDWSAGAAIEARVTAGMLGEFQHKTDTTSANVTAPNPFNPHYDRNWYLSAGFGRVSVSTSHLVPLGPLPEWGEGMDVYEGSMFTHPDAPDHYFVFLDSMYGTPQLDLPSGWDSYPIFDVYRADPPAGEDAETARCAHHYYPSDPQRFHFDGAEGIVTEVGFVCTHTDEDPETLPTIMIEVSQGEIVKTLPSMNALDVFRIPLTAEEGRCSLDSVVRFKLNTPADTDFRGYFYAVCTPLVARGAAQS